MGIEHAQALKTKTPVSTCRHATCDLRGFNGDGAAAATRVVQRETLIDTWQRYHRGACFAGRIHRRHAPRARGQHGGGQRFFQRRVALVFAPAAFEQRLAAGVQINTLGFLAQMQMHAHCRALCVYIWAHTGFLAEPVGDRIFHAQRRKVQAFQRTVLRGEIDAKTLARREPHFPSHACCRVVNVLLIEVRRLGQLNQHAHAQTAVQIQQQRVPP